MAKAKAFFAIIGTIGAVALVLHAIVFYTAMHYGAAEPAGAQIYRIGEHAHLVYTTWGPHVVIQVLGIIFLGGLGLGVPGVLLLEYCQRRRRGA